MLNLNLHIKNRTEERLKKILDYTNDQETFAQNIIAWQIAELKKGILNIRLDIRQFENKYNMSTEDFNNRFKQGAVGDTEDFLLWSGLYEMLCENERSLKGLE